jgi:hypothetical protein
MNPFGDLRSPQAVDVTIVSLLTIENLNSGAGNKGDMKGAVARAEEKKITLNTPACGISIKTHFASHQNDRLNFPLSFGVRPADPDNQLEDQTSLWNLGNIAQGHWVVD